MNTDNDYVPTDYADLYKYYIKGDGRGNSLCSKIIRNMLPHGTTEEFEDLPEEVFARILKTDQLKVFDPTKANFGGVIFYVTRTIVANHLARKSRDPLTGLNGGSLVETDPDSETFEPGTYSLERLFGGTDLDEGRRQDAANLIRELIDWAKSLHEAAKNVQDRNILPLLGLMAQEYTPAEAAVELKVTSSTIHNWMKRIRAKAEELRVAA